MEKSFLLGLAFGMIGGAVVVANSYKMRKVVINSQQDILEKIESLSEDREKKSKTNEKA